MTHHFPNIGAFPLYAETLSSGEGDLKERKCACSFMGKETEGCGCNNFASPPIETKSQVPTVFPGHGHRQPVIPELVQEEGVTRAVDCMGTQWPLAQCHNQCHLPRVTAAAGKVCYM